SNNETEERLVHLDDAPLFIPQLAIHLDREVNEKGLHLNKQEHLCPIVGLTQESKTPLDVLERLLKRHISFESLLSFELFLVPKEPSQFVGADNEMIASYRIDNLASAHLALTALAITDSPAQHLMQMTLFFENEEVGSGSKEGAGSPFANDVLQRICHSLKLDAEEAILLKNSSFCISLDMAHGLNPNYAKKHDTHNHPLLGKGIVVKYNANQKYASNALSASVVVHACQQLKIPFQSYVCRADMPCGSTIGPIFAQRTGINTVDIGCPQLSMHSIREVMACQDYLDMLRLLTYMTKEG
ncbi:MAG: M18 family aminopeptidase, partial [Chlamydiota bacterium]